MTDPEIKPCPFCGSDDIHYDENLNGFKCQSCLGAGPWAGDEMKAAELWNTRFDCFSAEHLECLDLLMQRDAEIECLENRIAELETPDMFWIADAPEEGGVNSASKAVNLYYGDCCCLQRPVEVRRAASLLPNIWVVLSENGDDIIENIFHTKEEAEQFYHKQFCQKMRDENHD